MAGVLPYVLAGVFLLAAISKLGSRAEFGSTLRAAPLSRALNLSGLAPAMALVVPLVELVLAAGLVSRPRSAVPPAVTIAFIIAASVFVAFNYTTASSAGSWQCACFGVHSTSSSAATPSIELKEPRAAAMKRLASPMWLCCRNSALIGAATLCPGVIAPAAVRWPLCATPAAVAGIAMVIGIVRIKRIMRVGARHPKASYFLARLAPLVVLDTYRRITPVDSSR